MNHHLVYSQGIVFRNTANGNVTKFQDIFIKNYENSLVIIGIMVYNLV